MRRLAIAGGLLAVTVWAGGCATTAPAPAEPRPGSPEALRAGPSLHETGRLGVVPVSNGGIQIEDPNAHPPPSGHKARATAETPSKRHGRHRTSQTP